MRRKPRSARRGLNAAEYAHVEMTQDARAVLYELRRPFAMRLRRRVMAMPRVVRSRRPGLEVRGRRAGRLGARSGVRQAAATVGKPCERLGRALAELGHRAVQAATGPGAPE